LCWPSQKGAFPVRGASICDLNHTAFNVLVCLRHPNVCGLRNSRFGWPLACAKATPRKEERAHDGYRLQSLINARGFDAKVIDWLAEITADCPKKLTHTMNDQCGARCPDLAKVL
jgi:hypothetical protein